MIHNAAWWKREWESMCDRNDELTAALSALVAATGNWTGIPSIDEARAAAVSVLKGPQ